MTDIEAILDAVANGRISADDGAKLIAALRTPAPDTAGQSTHPHNLKSSTPNPDQQRLIIRANARKVVLIPDHSVTTVKLDTPHQLRRFDNTVEVILEDGKTTKKPGFSLPKMVRGLEGVRHLKLGKAVQMHVNPNLVVDAEITAGALQASGIPWFGQVRVTGGRLDILEIAQLSDCLIQTGWANISGSFHQGRNRIRCETCNITLRVHPNSDVTVAAKSKWGKISWDPAADHIDQFVSGSGAARLDLSLMVGNANIKVGDAAL